MISKEEHIEELAVRFPSWEEAMKTHIETGRKLLSEKSANQRSDIPIHHMLKDVVTFLVSHCGFRDKFFFDLAMPTWYWGQCLRFSSKKIDSDFSFGFDYEGFYIETDIRYPEHLKRVDDEFWLTISSLHSVGDFKFEENAGFSSPEAIQAAKLFRTRPSSIFTLIRNAVFFEVFERDDMQDIGWLEVKWPLGTPWEHLLENSLTAFRKLYRINYLLYRAQYLQSHRQRSRNAND